jgi:hypothetical protein
MLNQKDVALPIGSLPERRMVTWGGSNITSLYTECINGLHEVRVAGEGLEGVGLIGP